MKLFVTSLLPETMLSLIVLETEADKLVIATNSNASQRLDELGIFHELIAVHSKTTHETRDKLGYDLASSIKGSVDGYDLANGLYPDRLRFWFMHSVLDSEEILDGIDFESIQEIYIETSLNEYLSWAIASYAKKVNNKIKVILVKSGQDIYNPEFRYIDYLQFDEILVSHDRDTRLLKSITHKPASKIGHVVWDNPKRPVLPSQEIKDLRGQLNIPEQLQVTGIIYIPQDDWKLLAYFREYTPKNYILFFREQDRKKFVKSVPKSIRDNAMHRFDSLSLSGVCNELLFPRYIPECDKIPSHVKLVFYDLNNIAFSEDLIDVGVV